MSSPLFIKKNTRITTTHLYQLFLHQWCCPRAGKSLASYFGPPHPPVTVPRHPQGRLLTPSLKELQVPSLAALSHLPHTTPTCSIHLPWLIPQLLQEESGCNRDYDKTEAQKDLSSPLLTKSSKSQLLKNYR